MNKSMVHPLVDNMGSGTAIASMSLLCLISSESAESQRLVR